MANVNFMMDDYPYKMYGIHVKSENENQNCRCWQVIYDSFESAFLTYCGT
jgi:hypothetical protein